MKNSNLVPCQVRIAKKIFLTGETPVWKRSEPSRIFHFHCQNSKSISNEISKYFTRAWYEKLPRTHCAETMAGIRELIWRIDGKSISVRKPGPAYLQLGVHWLAIEFNSDQVCSNPVDFSLLNTNSRRQWTLGTCPDSGDPMKFENWIQVGQSESILRRKLIKKSRIKYKRTVRKSSLPSKPVKSNRIKAESKWIEPSEMCQCLSQS